METNKNNPTTVARRGPGNPTWIKGGPSPNPSGRSKIAEEVKKLAQEHTKAAMQTIIDIMNNEAEMSGVRLAAAKEVLKQGGCGVSDTRPDPSPEAPITLTNDQLLSLLKKIEEKR